MTNNIQYQENIYPIWKPTMMSSNDVVMKIKKSLKLDKVGHCGTLDPFAEGVLIVVSGTRTSESDIYMSQKKTYRATITLGSETDTLDCIGKVIRIDCNTNINYTESEIVNVLDLYKGEISQRPPCFSAKRINGVRLYKLARRDIFVHLKPVKVHIEKIELISYKRNEIALDIECHKGTYIRQLGKDIARSLGTYGYLKSLVRTSIGDFSYKNSIMIEDI